MLMDFDEILLKHNKKDLLDLLEGHRYTISITEKLPGTIIYVQRLENDKIKIYKKNFQPLSKVDLLLSNLYKPITDFFNDTNINNKLNKKYIYEFNYINTHCSNICNIPQNFLILIGLLNRNQRIINDNELKARQAEKIGVMNWYPIIDNQQIYFEHIYNNEQFYQYIIDNYNHLLTDIIKDNRQFIVNIKINRSTCKYIFKVNQTKKEDNFKIPMDDITKIIYGDILSFLKNTESHWKQIILYSETKEDRFLELIYILFKIFMNKKHRYTHLKIHCPEIFNNILFQINYDLIEDDDVFKILNEVKNSDILLKYFILLLYRKKNNITEFINVENLKLQNEFFLKIQKKVSGD